MEMLLIVIMVTTLAVNIVLLAFAVTRADRLRTRTFTILCVTLLVYSIGYLMEVLAQAVPSAKMALLVQNFSIPLISPLFLLVSIEFFAPSLQRRWQLPAALCYGMIMFLVVMTNSHHMLYYTSITLVENSGGTFFSLGRGVLYFIAQGIVVLCILVAYVILIRRYIRAPKKTRAQIMCFIFASILAFSANLLNFTGIMDVAIDLMPVTTTVSFTLFALVVQRTGFLDTVVLARNAAILNMEEAFIVLDRDLDFLYCNDAARHTFPGLARFQGSEAISDVEGWIPELTEDIGGKEKFFDKTEDGNVVNYRARTRYITSESGKSIGVSLFIEDITAEQRFIAQLEELATTDSLTGIYNRRQFYALAPRELNAAARLGHSCAVISFDIDHFKNINDSYGHDVGDKVLRAVARVVTDELRSYDIFARTGGEEFLIFTISAGYDALICFAERLRQAIENNTVMHGEIPLRCTVSLGIAEIQSEGGLDEAIRAADMAMYAAKASGRNCIKTDRELESSAQ